MENKEKSCKDVIKEKVALIKTTSIIPEEAFERLLNHMLLYCELDLELKECWVDGLSLFGIKNYKDQRYNEFKRIFNLLKKIISKHCNCFNSKEETTETTESDWNKSIKW